MTEVTQHTPRHFLQHSDGSPILLEGHWFTSRLSPVTQEIETTPEVLFVSSVPTFSSILSTGTKVDGSVTEITVPGYLTEDALHAIEHAASKLQVHAIVLVYADLPGESRLQLTSELITHKAVAHLTAESILNLPAGMNIAHTPITIMEPFNKASDEFLDRSFAAFNEVVSSDAVQDRIKACNIAITVANYNPANGRLNPILYLIPNQRELSGSALNPIGVLQGLFQGNSEFMLEIGEPPKRFRHLKPTADAASIIVLTESEDCLCPERIFGFKLGEAATIRTFGKGCSSGTIRQIRDTHENSGAPLLFILNRAGADQNAERMHSVVTAILEGQSDDCLYLQSAIKAQRLHIRGVTYDAVSQEIRGLALPDLSHE